MTSKERARPLPRTPVALSVLNLLNERPMHPYEMRVLIRERGHDRAFKIRESSIYDTVSRLADRGFIEPVEVSREGRRPERTVYAITESGRDELDAWLWELASEPPQEYPSFAAPLMFIYSLGRDRAIAAFSQRAAKLEAQVSSSDAFRQAFATEMPDFPRIFGIEEEYAQAMRRAEIAWLRATIAELRGGTFPWPSPEDLPQSRPATWPPAASARKPSLASRSPARRPDWPCAGAPGPTSGRWRNPAPQAGAQEGGPALGTRPCAGRAPRPPATGAAHPRRT